jgi:hypothetical protein
VAGGTFAGSASKTFPVPAARLFRAWTDAAERERWLPAGTLTLRAARDGRSARFDLAGGGMLALWLTDKSAKSAVQVQHEGLPSKAAADAFRAVWKDHLGRLADHLDTT